jgi:hypothetical protein
VTTLSAGLRLAQLGVLADAELPGPEYGSRRKNWYWGSHRARSSRTAAWAINFDDGATGFNAAPSGDWNYFSSGFVKCVR